VISFKRRYHPLLAEHAIRWRVPHFRRLQVFPPVSEMNREGLMTRSERYLAKAEKCQQISDAADTSGTKRLYGVMASQWRQLAEEADWTDKKGSTALLVKIRHAHTLRQIDKAEGAIRELVALA
jgi:hypothetical protein